ncbi:Rec8 like protein-domain-containing protein [Kalaharituber pfeilii]|nr:Rec8 like protein-domain-containing protein [Kalaharituber pfeilii]
MFYSHEILTQRKHGIATVWLVATFGTRSTYKKVQRKDLLSVDVPKACDAIIHPEAPLALRLQSNLLFGVTKCYSQQYVYFLQDVANVWTHVQQVYSRGTNSVSVDLAASGKSRGDQYVLQDDPAFIPGVDLLELDDIINSDVQHPNWEDDTSLVTVGRSTAHSQMSSPYLAPRAVAGSRSHTIINNSSTVGEDAGWQNSNFIEEADFLADPGFEFGEDGMARDTEDLVRLNVPSSPMEGPSNRNQVVSLRTPQQGRERLDIDSAILGQVQRDHVEGVNKFFDYEPGIEGLNNRDFDMRLADTRTHENLEETLSEYDNVVRSDAGNEGVADKIEKKKRRAPNKNTLDQNIELRTTDLATWRDNYLANMKEQVMKRNLAKQAHNAKLNASKIILEWGIGGELRNPALKNLFSGKKLFEIFKGTANERLGSRGVKRTGDTVGIKNSKRIRTSDVGRGDGNVNDLDPPTFNNDGVEVARFASEDTYQAKEAYQDVMPWDRSAQLSRAGSRIGLGGRDAIHSSGGHGHMSAARSLISSSVGPASVTGRGSLHMSASPLAGRGRGSGLNLESDFQIEEGDEERYLGGVPDDGAQQFDEFEFFGAAAQVDTQQAGSSQWLRESMKQQSLDFLAFVRATFDEKQQEGSVIGSFITMDHLIPHDKSAIVAAQAFHHTLLLATEGLIRVKQAGPYSDIFIGF